jgi:hypothetical protein
MLLHLYYSVNVNVVLCVSDPDVAVTVTVEIEGFGVPLPPPQPLITADPITLRSRTINKRIQRRLVLPMKQNANARTAGSKGTPRLTAAAEAVSATVSVDVAAVPEGVTELGEKLHVALEGRPEQAKETAAANPFWGVMVIASVAELPALIVSEGNASATVKPGAGRLMV